MRGKGQQLYKWLERERENKIGYLPAMLGPYIEKLTSDLKMLSSACGLGQHFQDLGHSFSLYGPCCCRCFVVVVVVVVSFSRRFFLFLCSLYFLSEAA